MDTLFNPRSVAVIGASNSDLNLGKSIVRIMTYLDFTGDVYAVNPRGEDVLDTPGYTSVLEIPGDVELAVIITPAPSVPAILDECGQKGVKFLVLESAGFSEEGPEGQKLQDQVDEITSNYGMRYIGPNCLGVINTENEFCCFYGMRPGMYDSTFKNPGEVSYLIQSGGVGALIIDALQSDVTGVNKVVSIGNKADIDEAAILDYFAEDKGTQVIGMYLENIEHGRALMDAAKATDKPVLIYKIGRTDAGVSAALSHTAGMANNDAVFDAACRQSGILRLNSISELHSMPKIFTTMPLLKGPRIAIFTNSGAFGGISSDLITEAGLEVTIFDEETVSRLENTGRLYNARNPVDLGPSLSMDAFRNIFDTLLESDQVDGILAVPNVWMDMVIDGIEDLVDKCNSYGKPAAIYIPNAVKRILEIRTERGLPVFESLEEAVRALTLSLTHYTYTTSLREDR